MDFVYLAYITDSWHSTHSRSLIQVCSSKAKAIQEIKNYCQRYQLDFTQDDVTCLQRYNQTQCSEREMEFEIDTQRIV